MFQFRFQFVSSTTFAAAVEYVHQIISQPLQQSTPEAIHPQIRRTVLSHVSSNNNNNNNPGIPHPRHMCRETFQVSVLTPVTRPRPTNKRQKTLIFAARCNSLNHLQNRGNRTLI